MQKVLVGMSGGIDSSVTAYLLKEWGYEVEGISFLMWDYPGRAAPACCSLQAIEKTSRAARVIGIRHDVIDVREDFAAQVVTPFVQAYASGVTPNPCILCNRYIKFPQLMREAERRGAGYIATGHYARIQRQGSRIGGPADVNKAFASIHRQNAFLKKGVDTKKDQSYVLSVLSRDTLKKLILPLGDYTKAAVRKMGMSLGFPPSECPESQEICFIRGGNYLKFIQKVFRVEMEPGPILDPQGKIVGTHKGIYGYTIGQRKGLGISSPEPLYVVDIDITKNTVYTGPRDAAKKKEFAVYGVNWIADPPLRSKYRSGPGSGESAGFFRATVKVRSTMKEQPATIYLDAGCRMQDAGEEKDKLVSCIVHPATEMIVRVVFDEPQWAPAPGQCAVFYNDDIVIGGGTIKRSA